MSVSVRGETGKPQETNRKQETNTLPSARWNVARTSSSVVSNEFSFQQKMPQSRPSASCVLLTT